MTLATVDASSRPSARVVLIKDMSLSQGYAVFHTHYESRKAVDLAGNAWATGVLHWDALGRQIRLEGPTVRAPEEESDAYFATRPWQSQLNAWVSRQSQPLNDPTELDRRTREKARELGLPNAEDDGDETVGSNVLSRPPFWGGYRLWIAAVEFWIEGTDRYHERVRYQRSLTPLDAHSFRGGPWSPQRLQP